MTTHDATPATKPHPSPIIWLLTAAGIMLAVALLIRDGDPPTILLAPGHIHHIVVTHYQPTLRPAVPQPS
jgi:hypothetical protein